MKMCPNDKHPGLGLCVCKKCQESCPQNPKAWDIVKKKKEEL